MGRTIDTGMIITPTDCRVAGLGFEPKVQKWVSNYTFRLFLAGGT